MKASRRVRGRGWLGLLAVGLLGLAIGCSSARRSEPILGHPPAAWALEAGRRSFYQYCHSCHPGGEAGLGPALNNKPLPGSLIAWQARHGLGAMPAFDDDELSEEELAAIVEYLLALRASE